MKAAATAMTGVAGVLVVALLARQASPAAAVAGGVAAAAVRRARVAARREVARADERRQAVELLTGLALELRSGRSPTAALLAAADAGGRGRPLAARASRAARSGADVGRALVDGPAPLRGLGAAWRVSARTGAPLADAVERLAGAARAEALAARELDAALAGPRSSARLLAGLPLLGVLLAAGLGADPLRVLLHSDVGAVCLLGGVGLDVLGSAWTAALVRAARRAVDG